MGGVPCYDPRIARKIRYAKLALKLGGSVFDWKRMPETELMTYEKITDSIIRKERMKQAEMEARSRIWK